MVNFARNYIPRVPQIRLKQKKKNFNKHFE